MLSQWSQLTPGFRSASPSDEMEALQTDVMRFMAILGLCLMAIFALVQSLPIVPPDSVAHLESKQDLLNDITLLHNQAQQLKAEIAEIQKQLAVQQQELEQIEQARTPRPDQNPQPEPSTPQQKGFTLRFASEKALDQLIENETVSLFAFVGQQGWRLQRHGRALHFGKAQKPPAYYQMSQATVPLPYRQKLITQLAVHRNHQITWGVFLPASITTQIQQRVK